MVNLITKIWHKFNNVSRLLKWVSEWLLFNSNSAIYELYHGENKLIYQWNDDDARFVLDQHA
jgi:hypothetical protein